MIDQQQATNFALDIARGMSFLHSLDPMLLRYYLSSKHVVVDEDLQAKISMADTKFSFQERGRLYSPGWMSPEGILLEFFCSYLTRSFGSAVLVCCLEGFWKV